MTAREFHARSRSELQGKIASSGANGDLTSERKLRRKSADREG